MADRLRFDSMEELCRFVAPTLASLENLKSDQWELTRQTLYRSGNSCGIYFCLHGPVQSLLGKLKLIRA